MSRFRVGLFLLDRLNDYQALMHRDCEEAARRNDVTLSVHSADNSIQTQIDQIRSAFADPPAIRPRAVLVAAVSETALLPLIREGAKQGIGWVLLTRSNEFIQDVRRQYPEVPVFAVLPDQTEIGRIQGRQAGMLLKSGDEVVYIQGALGTYTARCRKAGLEKELSGRADLLWSHFNADWSHSGGQAAMKSWLDSFPRRSLPEFMIVAQNDSMAAGARQAVKDWVASGGNPPAGELRVIGCDGSPEFGQRLVKAAQLSATIIVPPVAGRALEEVVRALRFGTQPSAEIKVAVRSFPDLETLSVATAASPNP